MVRGPAFPSVLFIALEATGPSRLVLQLFDVVGGAFEILAGTLLTLRCQPPETIAFRPGLTRCAVVCLLHLIFLLRQASQATFCLRVVPLYSPGGTGSIADFSREEERGGQVIRRSRQDTSKRAGVRVVEIVTGRC